jgi:hypothetical protein
MSRYVAKPKSKTVQCRDCGIDMTVGWKTRTPKRCADCAVKRYVEVTSQIAAKKGPHYESWRNAMLASISGQTTGTPPPQKNIDPS